MSSEADRWPITCEPVEVKGGVGLHVTQHWTEGTMSEEITVIDESQANLIVCSLVGLFGECVLPQNLVEELAKSRAEPDDVKPEKKKA